jgi:16S rRNA (adenine1518-N6/adenine1519-N6)-dimethyltransferase
VGNRGSPVRSDNRRPNVEKSIDMGRPKRKRLGQNFLIDTDVAGRIVGLLDDEPGRVLEIGPGRGALTEVLRRRFETVVALELDERLAADLAARYREEPVEVIHADALHDPLDPILASEAPWQVASNLPYSVGTAILRRLLPRQELFTRLVVMLQREVAQRIVASPGDRNHGLLALERAAWADARIAFDVPPSAFRPRPKVVSSVVELRLHPAAVPADELERGWRLASHALTKPRKMLANAVRPICDADAVTAAGLDPESRPAAVDLDGWIRLALIEG